MYLLINSSKKDLIQLALFDNERLIKKKVDGQNHMIFFTIVEFLKDEGVDVKDVGGIMVVVEEGSFTSTRLAVTISNTFGYVLQIPLLAILSDQVENIQDLIPKLLKQRRGQYISATYSGEANIRLPKNKT